ncbi:MAG: biotin transporter BioY [Solobacterium sp.]|nr:biotin transporter BioY [Solobacterium sp.]
MKLTVKEMALTGVMAALLAVVAPLAIPLSTEVPISLATLAVMLNGALLGKKMGTLSVMIYIILGMIGIPVFAGYSAGAGVVFGMTGGYILGYLPLAYFTGWVYEQCRSAKGYKQYAGLAAGMLTGNAILYFIGTIWFMKFTGMELMPSLAACVFPFLPGDFLKMAVVCVLVPRLENAVMHTVKYA